MIIDNNKHVQWVGLSEYCDGNEAKNFLDTYGEGVPESAQQLLRKWVAAKIAYDANKDPGQNLAIGLSEARKAFIETE